MSKTDLPINAVFDFQRNAMTQTRETIQRGIETQQEFGEAFVDFDSAKEASERSYDTVRTITGLYFDAVESMAPAGSQPLEEFRVTIEESLDQIENSQLEAIDTFEANLQESGNSADKLVDEFLTVLDDGFEAAIEASEDAESNTVEAVEEVQEGIEELETELESQSEELTESVEEGLEQFEENVEKLQEQAEELVDEPGAVEITLDEDTEERDEDAGQEADETEPDVDPLETINGIGPAYAGRLREAGIESIDAIAEADVETIADAAEVPENRAEGWIEAAQSA